MKENETKSYRLTALTLRQIDALTEATGHSKANVIATAVDRMYQQEIKTMNAAKARQLAIETIEHADAEGQPVADTTIVGIDNNGYWVTDNGEEVNGLTKEQAIEIIVENLTA